MLPQAELEPLARRTAGRAPPSTRRLSCTRMATPAAAALTRANLQLLLTTKKELQQLANVEQLLAGGCWFKRHRQRCQVV